MENSFMENSLKTLRSVHHVDGLQPEKLIAQIVNADGTVFSYLPVPYKIKWFYIIYPNGKIITEPPKAFTNTMAIITAKVYADRSDNIDDYIGIGRKIFTLNDLTYQMNGETVYEKLCTQAIGRALTIAGFDYVPDSVPVTSSMSSVINHSPTLEEASNETTWPEEFNTPQSSPDIQKDTQTDIRNDANVQDNIQSDVKANVQDNILNDKANNVAEAYAESMVEPENNVVQETPCEPSQSAEDLTKALNTVCTFGAYKGKSLREVYEGEKQLIAYFLSHPNKVTQEEIDAVKIIVSADAELTAALKRKGLL